MEILPLFRSFFPFLNHSIWGKGFPLTLHRSLSRPFDSTLKSPRNPRTLGARTAKNSSKKETKNIEKWDKKKERNKRSVGAERTTREQGFLNEQGTRVCLPRNCVKFEWKGNRLLLEYIKGQTESVYWLRLLATPTSFSAKSGSLWTKLLSIEEIEGVLVSMETVFHCL